MTTGSTRLIQTPVGMVELPPWVQAEMLSSTPFKAAVVAILKAAARHPEGEVDADGAATYLAPEMRASSPNSVGTAFHVLRQLGILVSVGRVQTAQEQGHKRGINRWRVTDFKRLRVFAGVDDAEEAPWAQDGPDVDVEGG